MKVLTANCKSTRCYLIQSNKGYLLFDAGWPNEYSNFKDNVKVLGIRINEIKHVIVSHFHMDHAGLVGILQDKGIVLHVFENQVEQIDEMEELILRKKYVYTRIDKTTIRKELIKDSRSLLVELGIQGEILQIFGHGNQNVSLVLDSGDAMVGDLPIEYEYDELVKNDWNKLKSMNVKTIYPAHAFIMEIDNIVKPT